MERRAYPRFRHSRARRFVVSWQLAVKAKVAGLNYYARFEVPVYRVDDALTDPASQIDPVAAYRAEE